MIKELKEFLFKGNVLDLAVAVVIGAVFKTIIDSLVADVITPLIGLLFGAPDFSSIKLFNAILIGNFINAVVNFLIVGTVLFFVVKAANKAMSFNKKEEIEEEVIAGPTQEELLVQIRDLLAKKEA
ncbi:large conductance mechanosensitive channel protein MscL [Streptococcus iniae]|uniref:large conductance mechanosensitive channel protein MscL n=1 Tax=Streptococcus iniae TaxID=1346 RepID=UPI000EF7D26A|nr:large conductance mechanosensitive channel protein MscL [Streptococcus iniae]RLU59578.1 large conductance mechanosensitive channel protein MscL [Streptococcus iniae]RLU98035.1 large conductance mechanosensitive channel protein MscL [Streptococcus iniae]